MITKLSSRITTFFINKDLIKNEEKDIYIYCFELLVATLMNIIPIVLIGFCTENYISTLVYIIVFSTVRVNAGGFHADTHLRCATMLIVNFSLLIVMLELINIKVLAICGIAFIIFGVLVIFLIAPIDNPNNMLEKKRKLQLKVKSIIIILIYCIAFGLLLFFGIVEEGMAISYSIFSVSLSMIAGLIKNKIYKGGEKNERK